MKTGGIIGGVSWHSSMQIYERINTVVAERKGGLNCAKLILVNVNLNDIIQSRDCNEKGEILAQAALQIEKAGGEFVGLCSNGLHQYAAHIQNAISIPFIHIADATASAIQQSEYHSAGILGVRETMEGDFYVKRLQDKGIKVHIPDETERIYIDHILFNETGAGIVNPESSSRFYAISENLAAKGAECVILGCTEIGMLMKQEHTDIPLFDTTQIYADTLANLCCDD